MSKIKVLLVNELTCIADFDIKSVFTIKEIENTLESKQKLVDGLIEVVSLCHCEKNGILYSLDLVCNDEGKLLDMPPRCILDYTSDGNDIKEFDTICGPCFFVIGNNSNGEFESLNNNDIKFIYDNIRYMVAFDKSRKKRVFMPSFCYSLFAKFSR